MIRTRRLAPCLAAILAAFAANTVHAQVIFSEYVEGSSNNKALEIFNAGDAAVDLSQYTIEQYANGSVTPNLSITPNATLAAGDVYVIAHSTLAPKIGAHADQTANIAFNGDDALVLRHQGNVVDRIGQVGFRPTDAWVGASGASTKDNTLRRKASVLTGDPAFDTAFDVDAGWDAYPIDSFDGLGAHPGLAEVDPGEGGSVAECGVAATSIADLQARDGNGKLENVHVEAVVSASYTYSNGFSGFFVQTAESERVRRTGVSEGLFVYAPGKTAEAGQRVHLVGTIDEQYGQTQLTLTSDVAVCATGQAVQAEQLTLPLADGVEYAQYEGMLVEFEQPLIVNEVYELGRYGSIVLAPSLLQTPSHAAEPGAAAKAVETANARSRILLDDGFNNQNPATVPYPAPGLSAANTLRRGYTTSKVSGVLESRYSAWRLQPVPGAAAPVFDAAGNPRAAAPARTTGTDVRVVAFNVLNYFNGDGVDADGDGLVDSGFPTSRGAQSAVELKRQEDKIVAALKELDADVLGLMEIENDGYGANAAVHQLARRLGSNWSVVEPEGDSLGSDVIAVALLYRHDTVRPTGTVATLEIDDKNRVPLAQTFESVKGGTPLTVVVNHLKSKGCTGATGEDADQDDGQSCWNPTRLRAVDAITTWLAGNPTGVSDAGTLIIGDLNSYAKEEPIQRLAQAGYADLLARDGAGAAYTYVFQGVAGYLDHALANTAAADKTLKAQAWHINADEPLALEYTLQYKSTEQQDSFYDATAYRSSDHDPVIVDMALSGNDETPGNGDGDGDGDGGSETPANDDDNGGGALGFGLLAALAWLRRGSLRALRA